MLEQEQKYAADAQTVLPDLTGCLPAGGRIDTQASAVLEATYYDTADLRLARAGASLRWRNGSWTVKLPTEQVGVRHEISVPGPAGTPPAGQQALVTAYIRGEALVPVAELRTDRVVRRLLDRTGEVLAEVDDDRVTVLRDGVPLQQFREIEVERAAAGPILLGLVDRELRAAGLTTGAFVPKHVRALGPLPPPDVVAPGPAPGADADSGAVAIHALRSDIARMLNHDPLVRIGEPLPDGDTAVHQMRVGCRRLRSDLRTFRPLLAGDWAARLRKELSWLADTLGAARDVEVLQARLPRTARFDPIAVLDQVALDRVAAVLAARHDQALAELATALTSPRYSRLVDQVAAASAAPRLSAKLATVPAAQLLTRLVTAPWQTLVLGRDGVHGAADLDPLAPDSDWHEVRIRAKRARYALDAAAQVLAGPAAALASALGKVQDLLGEHQDAVIAADTWAGIARDHPSDVELAICAGRLAERERAAVRQVRARFPQAWQKAARPKLTDWLS